MQFRRAFSYVFRDPQWPRKLGLTILLGIVPAVLVILQWRSYDASFRPTGVFASPLVSLVVTLASIPISGYGVRIMRNVVAGHDVPLPEWANAEGILRDGLKLWVVISV